MHPFDLRTVIFARHAQHVVLIHFPIALFAMGVLFDLLGRWMKQPQLATAAYYNFTVAAISAPFALLTGFLAWHFQLEGQRIQGILLAHIALAVLSTGLIWIVWLIHRRAQRAGRTVTRYGFALQLAGVAIVGLTAHLGGFLSGVNAP